MDEYQNQKIKSVLISEKYDGVQALWDGASLRTRTGNIIHAPQWWIDSLPRTSLTGELWIGRGRFDEVRAIVQSHDAGLLWEKVRYMVFSNLPPGCDLRPHAAAVKQVPANQEQADAIYHETINGGGEGVVIIFDDGICLKRVPVARGEGQLVGYKAGRNTKIGSLILKLRDGLELKLGGLNDELKDVPPPIGSIIRFVYRGFTSSGLPRHAAYDGLRAETSLAF